MMIFLDYPYEIEVDPVNASIAFFALMVSAYLAYQIRKLNMQMAANEARRDVLLAYANFNQAMLNEENHQLFWQFMKSKEPYSLDNRVNHLLFLYINAMYVEYSGFLFGLKSSIDMAILEKDLCFLIDKPDYVVRLCRQTAMDIRFVDFIEAAFAKHTAKIANST